MIHPRRRSMSLTGMDLAPRKHEGLGLAKRASEERAWNIVASTPEHIAPIAENMREADRREVWASHRHTPHQALARSLDNSQLAWTCLVDGVPAFMWGVARVGSILSDTGAPWLLGTPDIRKVQRDFLRECPGYVVRMQEMFPRLENYVHADNAASIRWLRWCGFTAERDVPVMINDEIFYRFWKV